MLWTLPVGPGKHLIHQTIWNIPIQDYCQHQLLDLAHLAHKTVAAAQTAEGAKAPMVPEGLQDLVPVAQVTTTEVAVQAKHRLEPSLEEA
jgi:hypothetical protein